MTALRLESTQGTVLLNLNNVAGALLTKTDDGVEFIALTMIAGEHVKSIICLAKDVGVLDNNDFMTHSHTIAIKDVNDCSHPLFGVMNDIERGM